jgi:hypothetical protein
LRITLTRKDKTNNNKINGYIYAKPRVNDGAGVLFKTSYEIPEGKEDTDVSITLTAVDTSRSDVKGLIYDY